MKKPTNPPSNWSDNILYYVRPDEKIFGSDQTEKEWDNPGLLKGDSLHEVLRKIQDAGIMLTTETNLMTNGGLVIEMFDMDSQQHLPQPVYYEWYFKNDQLQKAYEQEVIKA